MLSEYQKEVQRTLATSEHIETLKMTAMGLAGEAGEIIDMLKKSLWHGHELDREKAVKECGDLLWYLAALCNALDIKLDDVVKRNVEKLRARYPDGFDSERSKNRSESNG